MFAHIPALTFSRSLQFPDVGLFSVAQKKKKKKKGGAASLAVIHVRYL